jgi:hypothetical protein
LLVLLLQQLLAQLLNKPQLQPEKVRSRAPQSGDDRAECRSLSLEANDWLTYLSGTTPLASFATQRLADGPSVLSAARCVCSFTSRLFSFAAASLLSRRPSHVSRKLRR